MSRSDLVLLRVLSHRHEASIRFEDLLLALLKLGFSESVRGSHHVFRKTGIAEQINLQRDGAKAKVYQVRQVRKLLLTYRLAGDPR